MTPEYKSYLLGNPALVEDLRARLVRLRTLPTPKIDPEHGPYVSVVEEETGKAVVITGSVEEAFVLSVPETMMTSEEEIARAEKILVRDLLGSIAKHHLHGVVSRPVLGVYEVHLESDPELAATVMLTVISFVFQFTGDAKVTVASYDGSENAE